jgi:hypothetical protein
MMLTTKSIATHVGPNIERFLPALRELLDHEQESQQLYQGETVRAKLGVTDPRLKGVVNPFTGKTEPAMRKALPVSVYTWARKIGRGFATMVKALHGSDWGSLESMLKGGEDSPSKLEELLLDNPDTAKAELSRLLEHDQHGDQVREEFLRPLMEMSANSPFFAPGSVGQDERMPVDPAVVKMALDKAGVHDPIGVAFAINDAYNGGEGGRVQYALDFLGQINDIYKEASAIHDKFGDDGVPERTISVKGMVPHIFVDARRIENLPDQWFGHHRYDRRGSSIIAQRVAAQKNFGVDSEHLAAAYSTVGKEFSAAKTKLDEATREITRGKEPMSNKQLQSALKEKLGTDYDRVTRTAGGINRLMDAVKSQVNYFRKDGNPDTTLNSASRLAHFLGLLMVNNPASAINSLEQLYGVHLRYGVGGSALGATARTLGTLW